MRDSGDRGASTLEYVGLLVVVAAVVGAVAMVALPDTVGAQAKSAMCKVFSFGSCGQTPQVKCEAFCPTKDNPIHPSDPVTAATKGGYVAMGDSFASGEGSNQAVGDNKNPCHVLPREGCQPDKRYLGNSDKDGCHRSANAFSQGLQKSYKFQGHGSFVACSGATTHGVWFGSNGEKSQLSGLSDRTSLVTLSVGGDDLGFAHVMTKCMEDLHKSLKFWKHETDQCHAQNGEIEKQMNRLFSGNPSRYQRLLEDIHNKAPNARVLVQGYPQLFPEPPKKDYDNVHKSDQEFLNQKGRELNAKIQQQVAAEDAKWYGNGQKKMGSFEYVDLQNSFKGHEITSDHPYLNGVEICGLNLTHNPNCRGTVSIAGTGSFHPTPEGQKAFQRAVDAELRNGPGRTLYDP